ncbi:GNAT family N-acetyltransferase [Streptomyces sp. WI03-4A]|uniref:GNAT family N-acetyltransferase n=1 Tax=Streptomyces sp. WI03-4A TaxID=3028706 RepID=UPI0029BBFD95|nr:GNAT family N-acetyltransferase [Streptomyces sp. WI03-4A]MDX2591409.1 GNAT family N-acetyltransferase [Streptomyces sp. WI03-4A]
MEIRTFEESDWPQVWPIVEQIIRKGDTFCYDPLQSEAQARDLWVVPLPGHVVVAVEDRRVVGTSNMYSNRPGPGSHIASGNFMVAPEARGRGVGQALGEYLLDWARGRGFDGVQFNAVAASNAPAVRLYERLGFGLIGTVPGAFRHPTLGPVGLHVMYHDLTRDHAGREVLAPRSPTRRSGRSGAA